MHTKNRASVMLYMSVIAVVFLSMSLPTMGYAASPKPSCTLTVTTPTSVQKVSDAHAVILIQKGETFSVAWKSNHAETAERNGRTLKTEGRARYTPKKSQTYEYVFRSGSDEVSCSVDLTLVSSSITTLPSSKNTTMKGKVTGVKKVSVEVVDTKKEKSVYMSKKLKVRSGVWKTSLPKKLKNGTYTLLINGEVEGTMYPMTQSTFTIGKKAVAAPQGSSTLVVQTVPLLSGGNVQGSSLVPVAYLQVLNIGKENAQTKGFWITQNGMAPTSVIAGFSVTDDTGTIYPQKSMNENTMFTKTTFIPVESTIAPGAMRLFTFKVQTIPNLSAYVGQQLKLDVTSVDTSATLQSRLPLRGTTWTIAL